MERVQANLKRYRTVVSKQHLKAVSFRPKPNCVAATGSYESVSVLLERILAQRRSRWQATRPIERRTNTKTALIEHIQSSCFAGRLGVGVTLDELLHPSKRKSLTRGDEQPTTSYASPVPVEVRDCSSGAFD